MLHTMRILLFILCSQYFATLAAAEFPSQAINVIVPFNPGGGSDTFVRILQKAIAEENLSSEPWVIINKGGAGGTIGSREVKGATADGHTILCLHDAIYTAQHYGSADWGPADFTPIAATGRSGVVIAVKENSPFKSIAGLMDRTVAHPFTVVYGTNLGAPSYYSALFLQRAKEGAKFRFTQTGGGAKRLAQLKGGHIDVTSFSVAEFVSYRGSGIRALAVLNDNRVADLPETPTAMEQGIQAQHSLTQFWWAPKETQPERVAVLADILQRAMETESVQKRLAVLQIEPVFLTGGELRSTIAEREEELKSIKVDAPPSLPPFEWLALGLAVTFGVVAWREKSVP
jgi:putative tricarboxylic transport membrane protein